MNLAQLLAEFRLQARDEVAPYLWSDVAVTGWLNEAMADAALRGRLLFESENPALCQIAIVAGQASYALHASLTEISYAAWQPAGGTRRTPLHLVSVADLSALQPDWRDASGTPAALIQGDTRAQLAPRPDRAGTLYLEGYRLPLLDLVDPTDSPELHLAHHRHLVQWALHRAFSVPDAEMLDPSRAGAAEAAFTDYFGARPDSDLRRATRSDTPHHNQAHFV